MRNGNYFALLGRLIVAGFCFFSSGVLLNAGVPAEQVPTFRLRARVVSSGSPTNRPGKCVFTLTGISASVLSQGSDWCPWLEFDRAAARSAVGPRAYPNSNLRGFPVVLHLNISGIRDPATVEAELQFVSFNPPANPASEEKVGQTADPVVAKLAAELAVDAPVGSNGAVRLRAELFGPSLGILLWRDEQQAPRAATMAEYNHRYWASLPPSADTVADRPKNFPIVDRFITGDHDRTALREGLAQLARVGFTALMLAPPDKTGRELLLQTGIRQTAGGVYCPPGFFSDHGLTTTQDVVAAWAATQAAAYAHAGFVPGEVALFAMSDEPGCYYPAAFSAMTNNPVALQRFRQYLQDQGLTSRDVGAAHWDEVGPIGRSQATSLELKRRFYWTTRFFPWDSARHFARCTRALEAAFSNAVPIFVNWNFFSGRFYVPGPVANNPDKKNPDAAMGGHDWFEFGRLRGSSMLWTEDWFDDAQAYQWSDYCARLRCAAELGGVEFGGYIVPVSAGGRPDGILQKILTLIGSGGKAIEYFTFGPEYNFPGNCYSENAKVLPKMAEAHRMIAAAEPLLWPGRRPRPSVAILMPRSAQPWDANGISDATNASLNRGTVDYMAETFDLYLALQHANLPVDFVDEDDLTPEKLNRYRVLYITEPNLPAEGQQGVVQWVRQGGVLVTVTGAGTRDRYNEPSVVLARGVGIAEKQRVPLPVPHVRALKVVASGTGAQGAFSALGVRGELTADPSLTVEAQFEDGAPAVVRRAVERGQVVHFTWLPGLAYVCSSTGTKDGLPVGWSESLRRWITWPVTLAGVSGPVRVDRPLIETPLLVSDRGAVVTLLNWSGESVADLGVTVHLAFTAQSVESVKRGKLAFEMDGQTCRFHVPLTAADFVMFK